MACPYFIPSESLGWRRWQGRMRPPLGEFFGGACAARDAPAQGAEAELPLETCNQGYPAGCCRFPVDGPQAARFAVASVGDGELRVRWSLERDHRPQKWGEVVWRDGNIGGAVDGLSTPLRGQLRAYVRSYLRSLDATQSAIGG